MGRTCKLHIPVTEGYFEDHYFTEGPTSDPYPVHSLELDGVDLRVGDPTCWDEWFPEVARCCALASAEVLCPAALAPKGYFTLMVLVASSTPSVGCWWKRPGTRPSR